MSVQPVPQWEPVRWREVYQEDCVGVMSRWAPEQFDLVFADPPYNASGTDLSWVGKQDGGDWHKVNEPWDTYSSAAKYQEFSEQWLGQVGRLLRPGGAAYVCCTYHGLGEVLLATKKAGLRPLNVIVWQKTNPIPNMTCRMYAHSCEYMVFAVKGSNWVFNYDFLKGENEGKQMRDVWRMPLCQGEERLRNGSGRAAHPTQKPEALVRRCVSASTVAGAKVLDPFLGSGTTAVVCEQLDREWVGIEIHEEYVRLALNRLAKRQAVLNFG